MAASPAMLVPVVVSISPVMAALAPERNSSAPPPENWPKSEAKRS